jgi:uncharacterized protein (TIGR03437 family)
VDCVLVGVNTTAIQSGVIATVSLTVLQTTTATSAALGVVNPASTSASANVLTSTASGASITIVQPPPPPPTWSLSGNVLSGSGATVNLTGAASRTATADASGNFSFSGLLDGNYTAIASKAGGTMTPATRTVTVNGASLTGVNFTYTVTPTTWTISGTSSSGATVTLGGAATGTTTADGSGKYSFTGLVNGSYTVAPWKTAITFSPAVRAVTLSGANQTSIDFVGTPTVNGAPQVDTTVWKDSAVLTSTLTSPAFATQQANELLLAFIGTSSTTGTETVRGVTGAGLTWTLVRRSNTAAGTAEIWRAFSPKTLNGVSVVATLCANLRGSLTVVTFSGVDTTNNGSAAIGDNDAWSANTSELDAFIVTSRNQSLVIGIGNDASQATSRTPASGQSIVHEFVDAPAGNYWVQRVTNAIAATGTRVVLKASPATTSVNLTSVEVRGPAPVALDLVSSVSGGSAAGTTASPKETTEPSRERRSQGSLSEVTLANAVTGEAGNACSPGGWASLLGAGFTAQKPQTAASVPLPQSLGGVSVKINGQPAPLLLASAEQVNFQCPNAPAGTVLDVQVTTESNKTWTLAKRTMSAAAPAIFTLADTDHAVVQIGASNELAVVSDPATTGRPARAGEVVRIYASGLGETVQQLAQGLPAPIDKLFPLANKVTVLWNGIEVEPLFAGLAPGTVGVFQVDLTVPAGATTATVPLLLRIELPNGSTLLTQPTVVPVESDVTLAARLR